MDKLYRRLTAAGITSLAVGIVTAALGLGAGVLGIVNGALLLRDRREVKK